MEEMLWSSTLAKATSWCCVSSCLVDDDCGSVSAWDRWPGRPVHIHAPPRKRIRANPGRLGFAIAHVLQRLPCHRVCGCRGISSHGRLCGGRCVFGHLRAARCRCGSVRAPPPFFSPWQQGHE
uniref:Uncharacterized protein n=1 Tax=Arundo donax TaxID=35708 RepID=A0A0A9CU96_ARUDO